MAHPLSPSWATDETVSVPLPVTACRGSITLKPLGAIRFALDVEDTGIEISWDDDETWTQDVNPTATKTAATISPITLRKTNPSRSSFV